MLANSRKFLLACLPIVILAACGAPERLAPVPVSDTARAMPLGLANARFYADADPGPMSKEADEAIKRELLAYRAAGHKGPLPTAQFLAVSGGGDDGAFGAGLLVGWTEAGNRPEFKVVTGVSTGSLIAPFAFLGPAYDSVLKDVYTTIQPPDIYRPRNFAAAFFNDAMADTSPLANLIARYFDEKMLAAVAAEHRKGRLLLIGTTDLDAQRPVIWNIGAIAASGHPRALALVHQILRASAAVPGAFQPVMIEVDVDGKKYQEMHVDGGAIAQLFIYPGSIRPTGDRARRAYVIRNAKLDPNWAETERKTLSIAGRAISTMLASSGRNDVVRTYLISVRDRVDFNLAYIGSDFSAVHTADFDRDYMNKLYDYGYQQAKKGYRWRKTPPGL